MRNAGLFAAALLLSTAARDIPKHVQSLRDAGEGPSRIRTPPKIDTAEAREIAEHNAAVDWKKAQKKAAKIARRAAQDQTP